MVENNNNNDNQITRSIYRVVAIAYINPTDESNRLQTTILHKYFAQYFGSKAVTKASLGEILCVRYHQKIFFRTSKRLTNFFLSTNRENRMAFQQRSRREVPPGGILPAFRKDSSNSNNNTNSNQLKWDSSIARNKSGHRTDAAPSDDIIITTTTTTTMLSQVLSVAPKKDHHHHHHYHHHHHPCHPGNHLDDEDDEDDPNDLSSLTQETIPDWDSDSDSDLDSDLDSVSDSDSDADSCVCIIPHPEDTADSCAGIAQAHDDDDEDDDDEDEDDDDDIDNEEDNYNDDGNDDDDDDDDDGDGDEDIRSCGSRRFSGASSLNSREPEVGKKPKVAAAASPAGTGRVPVSQPGCGRSTRRRTPGEPARGSGSGCFRTPHPPVLSSASSSSASSSASSVHSCPLLLLSAPSFVSSSSSSASLSVDSVLSVGVHFADEIGLPLRCVHRCGPDGARR